MDKESLRSKKVLVMGLGRFGGGVDSAKFAAKSGANVTVTDLADESVLAESVKQLSAFSNITFRLGEHVANDFTSADYVIANPAVPLNNKYLKQARDAGAVVTSQIALFFQMCPAAIVGITGANGKSTTTSLTAHLLRNSIQDANVWLSGNIGNEPLLMLLGNIKPNDIVILEISSFQVEQLSVFDLAPHIALLTNLTPNHLDRYGTFEAYCAAKEPIFANQKGFVQQPAISIFNAADNVGQTWYEKYRNEANRDCRFFSSRDVPDRIRVTFTLPGRANLENMAAALSIVKCFDVSGEKLTQAASTFRALPHRLELVGEKRGVRWYNDSKSTTPDSTFVALEAFEETIVLIAGGYDKGTPFDELGKRIAAKCKAAVLIGVTAEKIEKAIRDAGANMQIIKADSMQEAVEKANTATKKGDVVVMSPACASYDMFENYEQRGTVFKETVRQL